MIFLSAVGDPEQMTSKCALSISNSFFSCHACRLTMSHLFARRNYSNNLNALLKGSPDASAHDDLWRSVPLLEIDFSRCLVSCLAVQCVSYYLLSFRLRN